MKKTIIQGLKSRYYTHMDGLQTKVRSYKKSLPEGMEASTDYVDMLLNEPHINTARVRKIGCSNFVPLYLGVGVVRCPCLFASRTLCLCG